MKRRIIAFLMIFAMLTLPLSGCGKSDLQVWDVSNGGDAYEATALVRIEVAEFGNIDVELYGNLAPITVANFLNLVNDGFYDGLTFHRVVKNFVIQCGDPTGTGMGGSDKTIKGEFSANGYQNDLSHERGVISMGRKGNDYNSASSHFFICHGDCSRSCDGKYAAFGRVTEGMDVVDAIASVSVKASNDKPVKDVVVTSVTVLEMY